MHGIEDVDALFSVREPAWHGLGQVFDDYPTREQAQQIAHPWEPVSEPVYRRVPIVGEDGALWHDYEEIPGQRANVRSDIGTTLSVTTDAYESVTNSEMYDIAEAIQGEDSTVRFETGGSLQGGRKVWLLLRLEEPIEIKGDPRGATLCFYCLQNSHDATARFRGQATNVRVVCMNTSKMADLDASVRGTEFAFRHSSKVKERIEEAKQALDGWRHSIPEWQRFHEHLLAQRVTTEQIREFILRFIPDPPPHMASDRVHTNIRTARNTLLDILKGPTCEGTTRTALGLYSAAGEYHEHYRRARSQETRFRRTYLDRNTVLKDAADLALEVARV